jgi:hypothetical protein
MINMGRIIIVTTLLLSLHSGLIAQEIKPYLQSPTDTSIWISWKTDSDSESTVYYGEDSSDLRNTATGDTQVLSDDGYDNNYFYHSVQLSGLEPYQFYYYRVKTGSFQSSIFRFRTQPVPGNTSGIYRFLVFGDHQVKDSDRYERLLVAAREKIFEKYGGPIEEHVNLVINDGDQVDQGTLDQYEFVHFAPSSVLSGNVPIMTTVGNHETYGSLGLAAYYPHFFYENLGYKGIASPGRENYYSYQQKNVVFLHLSSEHPTDEQVDWVRQIVDSVKTDPEVDWLVSVGHRPIQAEQFVGDISPYIRDRIIPVLTQTEKSSLFIGGHHHLYARGQLRDDPMYHIISGGGSWDQYWGQSTEKDFDDVQKTIDFYTYQIVTIDVASQEMVLESYAIGSPKLGFTLDNILIDSFYRKIPNIPPNQPSITTVPADSVELPFTFESSPYTSSSTEPYNSVQFQISSDPGFLNPEIDLIRDFENLYGTTGDPDYLPVDIHDTVDIFKYTIRRNAIPNGSYSIRVRHRDRNITWSDWSDPAEFRVKGSAGGFTTISTTQSLYRPDETIDVSYIFGTGNELDWIGAYKMGDSPGSTPSTDWKYVDSTEGSVSLAISQPGKYYITFFENDSYVEITDRIIVYVVSEPEISLSKAGYEVEEEIIVEYSNAPAIQNDWIGIYQIDDTPGLVGSTLWSYTSGTAGQTSFPEGLQAGYYYVNYFLDNIYIEAGERILFSVGTDLAVVNSVKEEYIQGEPVQITFENSPGLDSDWIGIFRQNAPPGTVPLVDRKYTEKASSGNVVFDTTLESGAYFAALFINNSSTIISNKAYFEVQSPSLDGNQIAMAPDLSIYPVPSSGRVNVTASQLPNPNVSFKIVSLSGQTVFEGSTVLSTSELSHQIDLPGYTPGLYLFYLISGDQIMVEKLILGGT